MNINIDYQTRIPIYEQIVREIENLVTLEILKPGSQIMSIRDLACSLSINPNTVKKAYDILENKKIIVSKSTKGCFIADDVTSAKNSKINEIVSNINELIKALENLGLSKEDILKKLVLKD